MIDPAPQNPASTQAAPTPDAPAAAPAKAAPAAAKPAAPAKAAPAAQKVDDGEDEMPPIVGDPEADRYIRRIRNAEQNTRAKNKEMAAELEATTARYKDRLVETKLRSEIERSLNITADSPPERKALVDLVLPGAVIASKPLAKFGDDLSLTLDVSNIVKTVVAGFGQAAAAPSTSPDAGSPNTITVPKPNTKPAGSGGGNSANPIQAHADTAAAFAAAARNSR